MATYKAEFSAGAGMFIQPRTPKEDIVRCLSQWLEDPDRVVTHVVVRMHNGVAAEFTLEETPDGA
jgi:hypothetical protein